MNLAIQVVNYRTKPYLQDLLKDLQSDLKDAPFTYQINILDNNSGDELDDLKKDFPQLPISIYYSKENNGFGTGHNFLAAKTSAEFLLILNPDLKIVEPNTIARLYTEITADLKITVLGPKLIRGNETTQPWDHGHFIPFLPKLCVTWRKDIEKCSVAYVSGAVFLIRKSVFDQAKGFDPKIFLYEEEIDLCIRIIESGGQVIYDPEIKVMHFGAVSAKRNLYIKDSINYLIDKYYGKKFYHGPMKLLNNLIPYKYVS